MKKHIVVVLLLVVLLPNFAEAQRWKRFRRQIIGGVGVTNLLGDLGGANQIGRDFVYDLDLPATRPSLLVGYRYQFNSFFFGRANVQWGVLRGDDTFTQEEFRSGRNLRVRTWYFEADFMAEFYILQNARGNLYRLRGVRGRRGLKMDIYVYGGLGFMYFNPKGQVGNDWVNLQPLGTEGQGLDGEPDKYNRFAFTIPYGIGIGKSIDRYWQVNVEFTMRQTFTDYIDDISGDYYGRQNIYNANVANGVDQNTAAQIAFLSDPSTNLGGNNPRRENGNTLPSFYEDPNYNRNDLAGEQRGDPTDNDAFMTGMITISRKIVKRRRSRPKF